MSKQIVANIPEQPYEVSATQTARGLVQELHTPPFPQVPLAVSRSIQWDANGKPTVYTYKDALGATVATRTLTWTDGLLTAEAWS